ncbi:hypothetical protein KFE25_014069 [Diacronema lutheri]|uniref:NADH dehydrogenase [ubiquinone] 1 alpha subcomplex assembly factor 3 n=1 Tax=Diacronema lutheri TaxID=2081491 RepID=A0A8J6C4H8_DIALT|nr:hypothetical protein KFE25_014069 [Diacronema lutheri]
MRLFGNKPSWRRGLSSSGLGSGSRGRAAGDGGYNVDLLSVAGTSSEKPYMMVNAYSRTGFRVSGLQLEGSVCVAPHASFLWRPRSLDELSLESFRFVPLLEPPVDIVVVGCGARIAQLDPSIRRFFERQRIALEVQTSPNACSMFNFLNQEDRRALALLLPLQPAESRADE